MLCVYNNFPFVIMSPLSSGEYERIDVAGAIPAARRTCGVVYPMSNTEQKWVEIDSTITVDQHTSVDIVDGVWINKKNYFHWHFLRNSIRKPYRHRCRPIIAIKSNRQKWRGFWKASESSLRCSSIHTYYSCRSIYREMSYGKRLAALPLINYMNRCMKNGLWGTTSNIHTMFARSLQFASHFSDDPKIYMYI